jgi:integrase
MQRLNRQYYNFVNSIKSPETKKKYQYYLKRFLIGHKLTVNHFLSLPILDIENTLIDSIVEMKNKHLSTSYIRTSIGAIKHLLVMNDIRINKEKVSKFIGEHTKLHEDRPYKHEEILQLLNVCDLRMKAVVLLLATTGMRIGAIPNLRLADISEANHGNIVEPLRVTVYSGTPEKYITFCTPECSTAIKNYLDYRSRSGERLTPVSYLIREQFDINDLEQIKKNAKQVNKDTISNVIRNNLVKAGIRVINHTYDKRTRHKITLADGFRKFFSNQLIESDVKTEIRWLLEGHDLKANDKYYVRISEKKLYEEYKKAIDNLTINEENRLKAKVEKLEIERTEIQALALELEKVKRAIGQ